MNAPHCLNGSLCASSTQVYWDRWFGKPGFYTLWTGLGLFGSDFVRCVVDDFGNLVRVS